jgi:very-short-patch-repair endonuclease
MYRDRNHRDFARTLRNQPTDPEKRLWHFLRAQQLRGRKFRRQAAIGPYIVDFVSFDDKLIIELDGPQHLDQEAIDHDDRRTNWLTARGFQVVRFRNQVLDENIHAVVDSIARTIDERTATPNPPSPTLPAEGREPDDRNRGVTARES